MCKAFRRLLRPLLPFCLFCLLGSLLCFTPARGQYLAGPWGSARYLPYPDNVVTVGLGAEYPDLATAVALVERGGTVRIYPGTYVIDSTTTPILLDKSINLVGDGEIPAEVTIVSGDSLFEIIGDELEFANLYFLSNGQGKLFYQTGNNNSLTFRNVEIACSLWADDGTATYFYNSRLWPLKPDSWNFTGVSHWENTSIGTDISGEGGSTNAAKAGVKISGNGTIFAIDSHFNVKPDSPNQIASLLLTGAGRAVFHAFNCRFMRDNGGSALALQGTSAAVLFSCTLEVSTGSTAPVVTVDDAASLIAIGSFFNGTVPDSSIRYSSSDAGYCYDSIFQGKSDINSNFQVLSSDAKTEIPQTISLVGSTTTWADMPAGPAELVGSIRFQMDLSRVDSVCLSGRLTAAGTAEAVCWASYSLDQNAFAALSDTVSMAVAGTKYSGWQAIPAAARTLVYISLHGQGGDGVADPTWGNLKLQVKRGSD